MFLNDQKHIFILTGLV